MLFLLLVSSCEKKKTHSYVSIDTDKANTYLLKTKTDRYNITLENKNILVNSTPEPTIVLNLFTPSSATSVTHTQSLKSLESKNKGILVINIAKSTLDKESINFTEDIYQALDISNHTSNMLTVLYLNGTYYQHYEGLIPIEMIKHDIEQSKRD